MADKVEVTTKREGDAGVIWTSDGSGDFSVAEASNLGFERGTRITLKLKADSREFAKEAQITKLIEKFSQFISFPMRLNA